jgi:hypothetical protein
MNAPLPATEKTAMPFIAYDEAGIRVVAVTGGVAVTSIARICAVAERPQARTHTRQASTLAGRRRVERRLHVPACRPLV